MRCVKIKSATLLAVLAAKISYAVLPTNTVGINTFAKIVVPRIKSIAEGVVVADS